MIKRYPALIKLTTTLVPWLLSTLFLRQLAAANQAEAIEGVIQLGQTNFTSILNGLDGGQTCLIEFYASWCPACRHFAPTFEIFARFLKDKQLGGRPLYIARVDCATELNLCGKFDLKGFPSLLLGPARDFAALQHKQLDHFTGERDLSRLVAWVAAHTKTELKYSEQSGQQQQQHHQVAGAKQGLVRRPLPRGPVWSVADVEGATIQLWRIITRSPVLHRGPEKRAALRELLAAWAAAHPSGSCKAYSGQLLSEYEKLWPPGEEEAPATLLESGGPCGPEGAPSLAFRGQWVTCQGSLPESRGYSCGLWEMLHTMALRLPDFPGALGPAQAMMTFLTAFNTHFFGCEPCQKHFGRILASAEAAAVTDRRALVLWLWRVHNEVNERLRGIETKYGHSTTGDPAFPKEQWPAAETCPRCRKESASPSSPPVWVEDEVWAYLQKAYGPGSAPGADKEVKGARLHGAAAEQQQQLGAGLRTRSGSASPSAGATAASSASSSWLAGGGSRLLPALAVMAVALLVYWQLRRTAVGRRRGHGGGTGGGLVLVMGLMSGGAGGSSAK